MPESSLTRESDLVFLTRAGAEIGVASTKAFTTQLTALFMLVILLARRRGMSRKRQKELTFLLESLPGLINQVLELDNIIKNGNYKKIHLLKNMERSYLVEKMNTSKVYFHCSKETFGISIVESISAGCIPIVPNNSAHKETVPFVFV